MKRKTHEEFVKELESINNNIRLDSKYISSNDKVDCFCKICGNSWKASPSKLLIGRGCPACAIKKRAEARRNSLEDVLKRLDEVQANVELLGEYRSCDIPIKARCLTCGYVWEPTISNLYAGKKCPKCSKVYQRSNEDFLSEMHEINPNISIEDEFVNTSTKVKCKCLICGYIWKAVPSSLLSGCGCSNCAGNLKKDKNEFRSEVEGIEGNRNIILLGDYVNYGSKIPCQCKKCGLKWKAYPSALIKGNGCPQCNNIIKTTSFFKEQLHDVDNSIEVLGEYHGAQKKTNCKCLVCGNTWSATAHSLLSGHGCPKCARVKLANELRKSEEEFINELSSKNPDVTILSEYKGYNEQVLCQCDYCGFQWKTTPSNLFSGRGCPECFGRSGTSFIEQFILLAMKSVVDEEVRSRDTEAIGLELDVYIPSLKLAFEPGSWAWHKDKLERDELKRNKCKEQGIRLITIYDTCTLEEPPFDSDNYIFSFDLASETEHASLRGLLRNIMDRYGLDYTCFENEYDRIITEAKRNSRRRGTKRFINELKEVNPSIEVLGEYHRTHEKIKCRCKVCGNVWDGIPSGMLRGAGCPKCAGNQKKTTEEFIAQINSINSEIQIIGSYSGDSKKIECKCKKCGNIWKPAASSLVQGHGCPICASKKLAKKYAKSQEQFEDELMRKNPNVRILGEYVNAKTKILCECLVCNNKWESIPDGLLRGRGCPVCAKRRKNNHK